MGLIPSNAADIEAYIAEVRAAKREQRALADAFDGFDPFDLGQWLDLCERAGVPYIPAEKIAEIAADTIVRFDHQPPPPEIGEFYARIAERMKRLGDGHMVRWNICAGYDVKCALSDGEYEWRPEFASIPIDDPRAFEIICEYHRSTVAAYTRPWMKARIIDGWPVEYRVYVENGDVIGVSNYYPQRAIPPSDAATVEVRTAMELTRRLIHHQTKPLNLPQLLTYAPNLDGHGNHWTADFMRLDSGEIVFLEGGPPHTPRWGAHPCCFLGREVRGIALALGD